MEHYYDHISTFDNFFDSTKTAQLGAKIDYTVKNQSVINQLIASAEYENRKIYREFSINSTKGNVTGALDITEKEQKYSLDLKNQFKKLNFQFAYKNIANTNDESMITLNTGYINQPNLTYSKWNYAFNLYVGFNLLR